MNIKQIDYSILFKPALMFRQPKFSDTMPLIMTLINAKDKKPTMTCTNTVVSGFSAPVSSVISIEAIYQD